MLKKVAPHIGAMLEKYAELEHQWPKTAAMLLPAISIAAKTLVGAAAGGLSGAAAGFTAGTSAEIMGLLGTMAYGEQLGYITRSASDKLAGLLRKVDASLDEFEAKNLVAGLLLTAATYKHFKSEILDVAKLSKTLKPKTSDFTELDLTQHKFEADSTKLKPLDELEGQIVESTSHASDKLSWQELVVRGDDGRIVKILGTQEHHVIHQKLKDHELFKLAGMDAEDSINKMLLPTKEGASNWNTKRSIHQGRHFKKITDEFEAKMKDIEDIGKAQGWSTLDYQRELKKLIQEERSILRSGHRALNKNKREWADR